MTNAAIDLMATAITNIVSTTTTNIVAAPGEIARIMIEQNISFLHVIAETTMTWWVTSIVFWAGILAGFWLYKDELIKWFREEIKAVAIIVSLFMLSFPIYGGYIAYKVSELRSETVGLLKLSGFDSLHGMAQFDVVQTAVVIGVFTFFFPFVLWLRHVMKMSECSNGHSRYLVT